MAFTVRSVMDQRVSFVLACRDSGEPMSVLCERYGISRKTGYKWLSRYEASGVAGLEDRSRATHHRPHGLGSEIMGPILALRAAHPTWGPRKLLARLEMDFPAVVWPAASTVGDHLRREGLVRQRRQRRPGPAGCPLLMPEAVNESWSADFKGWFRTGDGVRCEPLTVTDNHSRASLACQGVARPCFEAVVPIFERVMREYGMPLSLRTDRWAPFGVRPLAAPRGWAA